MELVIIFVLLIALIGVCAFAIYSSVKRERLKRKPNYIVYLMKIEDSGNIEIKKSPKQDMWNWKF